MKLTILLLLASFALHSQCLIEKKYDQFEDITSYIGEEVRVSKYMEHPPVEYTFLHVAKSGDRFLLGVTDRTRDPQSTYNSGTVILLFKDGSKMQLEATDKAISKNSYNALLDLSMWVNRIPFTLSLAQMDKFSTGTITAMRIKYDDLRKDITFNKKAGKAFKELAECLVDLR